jgi:hypothetical protein
MFILCKERMFLLVTHSAIIKNLPGFDLNNVKSSKSVEFDPDNLFTQEVLKDIGAIKNQQVISQVQAALQILK